MSTPHMLQLFQVEPSITALITVMIAPKITQVITAPRNRTKFLCISL